MPRNQEYRHWYQFLHVFLKIQQVIVESKIRDDNNIALAVKIRSNEDVSRNFHRIKLLYSSTRMSTLHQSSLSLDYSITKIISIWQSRKSEGLALRVSSAITIGS